MNDAFPERPRRPLRETVCDIDRDIIRLLMRRHNLVAKMCSAKGRLSSTEEKYLREAWEAQCAKVSNDPRLSSRLFSLIQEIDFQPKPSEDDATKRTSFGLAPVQKPINIQMPAPLNTLETRIFISLAASTGEAIRISPTIMNDNVYDCVRIFNQMGANFVHTSEEVVSTGGTPCATPDKVLSVGDSELNFYLALARYIGYPSRAKFTARSQDKVWDLTALRRFLPEIGARLINILPKSSGMPVRIECSGLLPELITIPEDLPSDFVLAMLLSAPSYTQDTNFSLSLHPQKIKILHTVSEILRQVKAVFRIDGEKIHISPSILEIPPHPLLHMSPRVGSFLLAFAPAFSGTVRLEGCLSKDEKGYAIFKLFDELGLQVVFEKGCLSLTADKDFFFPRTTGLSLSKDFPEDMLPLAIALSCIYAFRFGKSHMPRGYEFGSTKWTVSESFLRACDLDCDEEGTIFRKVKRPEDGRFPPVWTAPSAQWAMALALVSCARPEGVIGFRLSNPGIITGLYPNFWLLFNALPEAIRRHVEPEQQRGARRVRTSALAQLTPREEDY